MALAQNKRWTPEEYLAFERDSEIRHEYLDGEVYAMAGGSRNHSKITVNVSSNLHNQLRSRDCTVFSSDMRVDVAMGRLYAYPDISVVCGEAKYDTKLGDMLLNPTVLIEVTSPSTERYDREEKFRRYRRLISLREYLVISQGEASLEHYTKQANGDWILREVFGLEAEIELASIQCKLALADIYEKVTFDEGEIPSEG